MKRSSFTIAAVALALIVVFALASVFVSCGGGGDGGGDTTAPTMVTGFTATAASSSQIDLSWTASTDNVGVTGYKIYRGGMLLKSVPSTTTSDTGLSASTQYCYAVSAYDAANNESAHSGQKCATTQSGTVNVVPQNPSATSGVQKVTIRWDSVAGSTTYNIYYLNTPGVTKATGTKLPNVASPYQHANLSAGTYYYVVTAVKAAGESNESTEVSAPVNLLVFVTSVAGNGNLSGWTDAGGNTGLTAGDAICQARASAAGLTGAFKAWLSDSNNDAYCRVHNFTGKKSANCGQANLPVAAGPWVRTDGFPFSETIDQLLGGVWGKVYTPVRYDEFGNLITGDVFWNGFYFTNTYNDGTVHPSDPSSCSNWSSSSSSASAGGGATNLTSGMWTSHIYYSCNDTRPRLLCMQTGVGPFLPAFASTGKKAFVTSVSGSGNLSTWTDAGGNTGLAAGDAICQARAAVAGLANAANFKAWLSSSTIDAKDRITSDGPWVRLDGVKIADNKADLIDGSLFTSISQTEAGDYRGNYGVWTGTGADGIKSANTCSDWTSASNAVLGAYGVAGNAGSGWSAGSGTNCDGGPLLYCLED